MRSLLKTPRCKSEAVPDALSRPVRVGVGRFLRCAGMQAL